MTTFIIILIVLAVLAVGAFSYKKTSRYIQHRRDRNLRMWCMINFHSNAHDVVTPIFLYLRQHRDTRIYRDIALRYYTSDAYYNIEYLDKITQYIIFGISHVPILSSKERDDYLSTVRKGIIEYSNPSPLLGLMADEKT